MRLERMERETPLSETEFRDLCGECGLLTDDEVSGARNWLRKAKLAYLRESGSGSALRYVGAAGVDGVGAEWRRLAWELEQAKKKKNYVTSADLGEICRMCGIARADVPDASRWLRRIGVAHYFDSKELDELDELYLLNPDWLAYGIDRFVALARENGFLSIADIRAFETVRETETDAPKFTYDRREKRYILDVMRAMGISRHIGNGMELIPHKLPKFPPDKEDAFAREHALHHQWRGDELTENEMIQLIIRNLDELDRDADRELVWKWGALFTQTGGCCRALAELNRDAIDIFIAGETEEDCQAYLHTFRQTMRVILNKARKSAKEMKLIFKDGYRGWIPCERGENAPTARDAQGGYPDGRASGGGSDGTDRRDTR